MTGRLGTGYGAEIGCKDATLFCWHRKDIIPVDLRKVLAQRQCLARGQCLGMRPYWPAR